MVRNNLMLRADPPSFVFIDYGGSKETLWPAALGYGAKGQGGQRFRPPTEETDAPVMSTHGDFFRLARTVERDFYHPVVAGQARTLALPEAGSAARAAMALDHGCSRATLCRTFTSGKMLPRGRSDRTLPTSSRRARGSKRPTSLRSCLRPAYGPRPVSPALTPVLERKGNDRGHFVSEPISSLTESTGSWEGSAHSPRLMLICELKAKGNFYRPVAQEVSPWFAYSNDDGYLVKEAPPLPPMAPTASPPGPARDLDPFRGILADPPADSGDRGAPGRRRRHAATSPRHGRASGHELCGVDGWNHSNSSFLLRNIQAL